MSCRGGPDAWARCSVRDEKIMTRVHILGTGGTIAGQGATDTSSSYRPGSVMIQQVIDSVPGLDQLAEVTGEQFAQVSSQDMNELLWQGLANRIDELFEAEAADGIVITHGTDTAEETGYFLHLTVKSSRPVVLTGSMRPATSLSADGPLNLYNAVSVAADLEARNRGVMLAINDDLHSARDVTKSSTTDVQTFISPGAGLLGTARLGRIRYYRRPVRRHTLNSIFTAGNEGRLPRVDVLYAHAGMSPDLVRASVSLGTRGIVVAGVGNGNVPGPVVHALREAVEAGVRVVRSARVGNGDVERGVELDDDALGFVVSDQLNPQKSRVLLQLCLAHHLDSSAVQNAFYQY
ncbi:asparaginase [Steroidobacter sp.]|uniref:asparaginase n=1 Tax=Steroidobacter sp. TaxID=1978227 RepID=UPI0039C8D2F9